MSDLEFFKKLEDRYNELVSEAKDYEERLAFLEDEFPKEAEMYNKLTVDDTTDIEVIRQMCPNAYELEVKKRALIESVDKMETEIEKRAKELKKEMDKKVVEVKTKLEKNEKHLEKTEAEIEKIKTEIDAIKASDEYKNKDEDTILKLEDLEAALEAKEKRANTLRGDIEAYKAEITDLENEIEKMFGKYIDIDEPEVGDGEPEAKEQPEGGAPVTEEPVTEEHETKEEPTVEPQQEAKKVKPKKVQQQAVPDSIVSENNNGTEQPVEENNSNLDPKLAAEVDKAKTLREKYDAITSKDPETLTVDERIELSNILADKANYDKLGIRTGVIFNDSKKMLKTIATGVFGNRTLRNVDKDLIAKAEGDLLPVSKLLTWKGIQEVGEGKLALEQSYENVVAHYEDKLDDPKNKKIYDQAKKGLEEIQALKNAVKTNNEVTLAKRKESKLFNLFGKKEDKKMLQSAPEPQQSPEHAPTLADVKKGGIDMTGLTNPPSEKDVELAKTTKSEVAIDEQTK